jgi:hypothetical protein
MKPYGYEIHMADLWDWPDPSYHSAYLTHSQKVYKSGARGRAKRQIRTELETMGEYAGAWGEEGIDLWSNRYEPLD